MHKKLAIIIEAIQHWNCIIVIHRSDIIKQEEISREEWGSETQH
jgi:hypothetical protein